MKIKPLDTRWTAVVASWLNDEINWKWIRYDANNKLDPVTFRLMTQKPIYNFNLFFDDNYKHPIGIVAFSNIDLTTRNATLWYILGDKNFSGQGYTTRAVNKCLQYGFRNLKLESVFAGTVRENPASIRILEKNHFNHIGVRRKCHLIDGTLHDQLQYYILAAEFLEMTESSPANRTAGSRKKSMQQPAVNLD